MLARRYLHHLRAGLRPLEVIAVTFTRRAAEELRARVRRTVADALRHEAATLSDPDLLAEVEAAPIGTIHALAQIICRRYPEAAEVPPDFSLVDELDAKLWAREALDEALATLPEADLEAIGYPALRLALNTALEDPTRARRALAVDPEEVRAHITALRHAAFAASVDSPTWQRCLQQLSHHAGPADHPAELNRQTLIATSAQLSALGPDADPEAVRERWVTLAKLPAHKGALKGWQGSDLRELKALLRACREQAEAVWMDGSGDAALFWGAEEEAVAHARVQLRGVLERALAIVDARKARAKALTFADLETHALRALADPNVRMHVQRRWRALLVDEVQDVNPTQAQLLEALRGADTPLTVVGDVKQSIYGFRGAEPQVLSDLRRRVAAEPGGALVELNHHYRSHERLVAAVGRIFEGAFGEDAGTLEAQRPAHPSLPEPIRLQRIDPDGEGNASSRALAEVHAIAAAIRGWLEADPPVLIDTEEGLRPIGFGDVAVLARGHTTLALLESHLPTQGVPVVNVGGGNLLGTQESRDMRVLLRALIDPSDGLAIAALLRSPYANASDRDIVTFITHAPESQAPWWRQLEHAPAEGPIAHLAALLAQLRHARAAGARASDLCELADRACDMRALLANLPQGPRRVADHDGMVALLRRLEQGHAEALGVVRRLEQLVAAEVEVARPPLRASGAVSLLTMHAAKGLEWPAVVVADLSAPSRPNTAAVLIDPELGFTISPPTRLRERRSPSPFMLAARRAAAREVEEARRLAYVAFTRARDLLLISDRGGRAAGLRAALGDALETAGLPIAIVPLVNAPVAPPPLPPLPACPDPHDRLWQHPEAG